MVSTIHFQIKRPQDDALRRMFLKCLILRTKAELTMYDNLVKVRVAYVCGHRFSRWQNNMVEEHAFAVKDFFHGLVLSHSIGMLDFYHVLRL